jgi:formylglycine-generating enzyme required for sulfatase activity
LDLSGNVWEWCATKWVDSYEEYGERENNDPEGDAGRVVRGGAFDYSRRAVRCACRDGNCPDSLSRYLGFRPVVAPVDSGL